MASGAAPRRRPLPVAEAGQLVSMRLRLLLTSALALCTAPTVAAQQLGVLVRDSLAQTPVAGAIVTATEQTTGTRVYGLTNEDGRLTLRIPNAGSWGTSVRRIGLVPISAPAVRVDEASTVPVLLAVANFGFSLPRVGVTAKAGVCGRAPSGVDRTSALWEQVTLALRSSALTRRDAANLPSLRVTLHERTRDRNLALVCSHVVGEGTGTDRPFFAADPDTLARFGYVRADLDGMISYFAPDDVVMLSDAFIRTHCFSTPEFDANPALAELEFQPVPRRSVADVAGVAFVYTISGELRRIVFRCVNAGILIPRSATFAGGEVSVRRLENGQWIVADWASRMPRVVGRSWEVTGTLVGYRGTGGSTVTAAEVRADSVALHARLSDRDSLSACTATRVTRRE